jgi:hypothetical protein
MASLTRKEPVEWLSFIVVLIGLWLIFVGIRFVYQLHPAAGIVCIVAGVILIVFYFLFLKGKAKK